MIERVRRPCVASTSLFACAARSRSFFIGAALGDTIVITREAITKFPYPMLSSARLLNVLHLLAHALELRLQLHHPVRDRRVAALRPDRIHLAQELLEQELELAPHRPTRPRRVEQVSELIEVTAQAHDLFGDVHAVGRDRDLLVQARLVEQPRLRLELARALAQPLAHRLLDQPGALLDLARELADAVEPRAQVARERGALARAHRK